MTQRVFPSQDISLINAKAKSGDKLRQLMKEVDSSELKVGDILQLKQGDICPCDLLILNTSDLLNNKYVCTVNSWFATGVFGNETKYSLSVTRPFGKLFSKEEQILLALNRLSGTIEYWPFGTNEEFKGTFKLKSDPKVEDISQLNLIRKGSLLYTRQVTGIVLFCGNGSLNYRNCFSYMRKKTTTITRRIHWYSISAIVLNLIFSLISTMLLMIKSSDIEIVDKLDPHVKDGLKLFSFIVLYSPVMPLFVVAVLNLLNAFQAILLERKYRHYLFSTNQFNILVRSSTKLDEKNSQSHPAELVELNEKALIVNNPSVLTNMGCVDEVFFDKTGTLTYNNLDVQSFATRKKVYKSNVENFRIEGMANQKKDFLKDENDNDSDRSFEGFDEDLFRDCEQVSTEDIKEEVEVYDFGLRRPLANPFAQNAKALIQAASFNEHDTLENDQNKSMFNEKFIQINHKKNRGPAFTLRPNSQEDSDKIFDEIEFLTDTKTDKELKTILQLFTVCHNSKIKNEE